MPQALLKARAVFLDTEVYLRQKFRFDHPALKKVRDLGRAGFLRVLTTHAVDGEVRRHIDDSLNHAIKTLGRFQNHAGFLEASPSEEFRPYFKPMRQSHLFQLGMEVWEKFVTDAKVEVVGASAIRGTDLLDLYFAYSPPFSAAKKSEFPDAISLLSLEKWRLEKGSELYLISTDPDVKAWCEGHPGMHHIETLKEFLDLYNRAEDQLTQLALGIYEREEETITSALQESFLECTFVYANNWDADVENVAIISTRVDDVGLIEVDERRFILALVMEITFRAEVSGPDLGRGSWDSEERMYAYLPTFHLAKKWADVYNVSFEVEYNAEKSEMTEIKDIMFDDGRQITLRDDEG